ncbi:MAG: hypothetical protein J5822_07665 [Eubacteriaceae bacterium]|nr:hypothetical protein [Eubacteriaceae bacterium]
MSEKAKAFFGELFEDHLFSCIGCFSCLIAVLVVLAYKVHENFIVYPMIAIGCIAVLIAFLVYGIKAVLLIPLLGLPVAVIAWLALSIMERIPMISAAVFAVIGIISFIIQKTGTD